MEGADSVSAVIPAIETKVSMSMDKKAGKRLCPRRLCILPDVYAGIYDRSF